MHQDNRELAAQKPMTEPQPAYRNQLLRMMAPDDLDQLRPHLEAVSLVDKMKLASANQPIERLYFPESGMISVVATMNGPVKIDVGLVGCEGLSGVAVILGDLQSPLEARLRIAGKGHAVEATLFANLLADRPAMRRQMLRYAHGLILQIARTALVNGRAKIPARVARWLLMMGDRIGDTDMLVTHEMLAAMVGARRPSVTDALAILEDERLIEARRSSISIQNRAGLETFASGFYGEPERDYQRIVR